ncbi:hypothetical protein [Anatilimnocola aggregata]|uniref:hypothetical protein n=1 Tax=Anatilimnocola aggregata TaxID=2528021 RepID=UPI0011A299E0|nr:hypothetical protein [Anatilimnocola aggregata]
MNPGYYSNRRYLRLRRGEGDFGRLAVANVFDINPLADAATQVAGQQAAIFQAFDAELAIEAVEAIELAS